MFPKVKETLSTPAVSAIVGQRIAPFGEISQDQTRPYVTWYVVADAPHDNLSDAPPSDFTTVHIDGWSADAQQAKALGEALRAALDAQLICNRTVINTREPSGTRLYRIGLEADFITNR